jgi:predicted nucleic acid-binding protein
MRVYLDNCCFNRPFDDQTSLTIRLETEAKLSVQEQIKTGKLTLGWSYVLDYENQANPFLERRFEIEAWKILADSFTLETPEILINMKQIINYGLKSLDALHIACAIALKCDYFLTVDKGILKKAFYISDIKILSPIDFVIQQENLL